MAPSLTRSFLVDDHPIAVSHPDLDLDHRWDGFEPAGRVRPGLVRLDRWTIRRRSQCAHRRRRDLPRAAVPEVVRRVRQAHFGAIVPTYNVPEARDVQLNFTPDSLSGIFLGDIQTWNDPRLVADNPVLAKLDQPIVVVHRSDGSGTTFGFTDYLSSVSPDWQAQVGVGTSVNWPVGLGASGNPGVAGEVQQDPYSIGYVELIYAIQNNLGYGMVQNSSGAFINPSLDSVTAAAASAASAIPADLRFSIVNSPGADAYPISTATWLLAYRDMTDRAKGLALTRMLWWATHEGQRFNHDLAYATIPAAITARSEELIRQIAVHGVPVFPNR